MALSLIVLESESQNTMTPEAARRFVKKWGVVLEGGRGPIPNLAETVAGESIRGSWWGHPKGQEIFWLSRSVREWREVLVCRVVSGKVTYVHRRLWPALVRLAPRLDSDRLAALHEVHTAAGRHELQIIPFPRWVPPDVRKAAKRLTEADAARMLGDWVTHTPSIRSSSGQPNRRSQPTKAQPRTEKVSRSAARLRG